MGDSTCLMQQPFCYASGISNEANENNPIHALGQSISFGRFMSESLAWEKWSSFSHNRYVEEAERYSRPGSVAQKKAFFEAHYKKLAAQKAAALLEQANKGAQNNATGPEEGVNDNDNVTHPNDNDTVSHQNDNDTVTHNSQTSPNSEMVIEVEQDAKVLTVTPESVKVEGTEAVMEEVAVVGNSMEVELQNQLEDLDDAQREKNVTVTPILTPLVKQVSISDQEVLADVGRKKPPVSSFKLSSKVNGTSKFTSTPVKSTAAIPYKKENIVSPMSIKPANGTSKFTTTPVKPTAATSFKRDNIASPINRPSKFTATPIKSTAAISFRRDNIVTPVNNMPVGLSTVDKKRSTPRSVNFTPIRELNRLTASVMRKFESTRAGAGPSRASKDNLTPIRTPTMASKEIQKHSSLTPLTEKKRNKTPLDLSSAPRSHTGGPKWSFLSGEMKSPLISSPFSLRTEERAARRKKKLEEKFNANEAQKVQLQTKHKDKTETEIIRKLRQSFCFKARPLPDFYKERKISKSETKKVAFQDQLTRSEIPKDGRKPTPTMAESKTYFPPNRPILKTNGTKHLQGKSGRTLTHPLTSTSHIIPTHENASPNIQHGYLHSRNYKY
ncbi:protein WVD2-like 4 isoform X3 [Vigna angularis]|uniref:protein WVD2-like 4 isoform X3 n=1 Tax=Phaseolus angularis TaxID=3914 RepID=UPI0022B3B3A8|nr:protein WVD2-like 4 isoform X3 [Vigna angularis]